MPVNQILTVKIFDQNDRTVKLTDNLEHQNHSIDIISDNSFKLSLKTSVLESNLKKNDLVFILDSEGKNNDSRSQFFYVVDKVFFEDNTIQCKNVFNAFDQKLEIIDTSITLKKLLDDYFKNASDIEQNIAWLDTTLVDNTLPIKVLEDTQEGGLNEKNTIFSTKEIIINTILGNRFVVSYENDLNNGILKLIIQLQQDLTKVNLNNTVCRNLDFPSVEISTNTLDLILEETKTVEVTDVGGDPTSVTNIINVSRERWILLSDNTVSVNLADPNRLLPPKIETQKVTFDTLEPPNTQKLAEDKMVDNSNLIFSFEMDKNKEMYLLIDSYLNKVANPEKVGFVGELYELYYNDFSVRTVLTGIEYFQGSVKYTFGTNRLDLLHQIKKKKGR